MLVNHLKELIREEEVQVKSRQVIHELNSFVYKPDGKMEAQEGAHDDCVIAMGIAVMMAKLHPPTKITRLRKAAGY